MVENVLFLIYIIDTTLREKYYMLLSIGALNVPILLAPTEYFLLVSEMFKNLFNRRL